MFKTNQNCDESSIVINSINEMPSQKIFTCITPPVTLWRWPGISGSHNVFCNPDVLFSLQPSNLYWRRSGGIIFRSTLLTLQRFNSFSLAEWTYIDFCGLTMTHGRKNDFVVVVNWISWQDNIDLWNAEITTMNAYCIVRDGIRGVLLERISSEWTCNEKNGQIRD